MTYALISLNRNRLFVKSRACLKMYVLPTLQSASGLPKLKFCEGASGGSLYSLSCIDA